MTPIPQSANFGRMTAETGQSSTGDRFDWAHAKVSWTPTEFVYTLTVPTRQPLSERDAIAVHNAIAGINLPLPIQWDVSEYMLTLESPNLEHTNPEQLRRDIERVATAALAEVDEQIEKENATFGTWVERLRHGDTN